MTAVNRSRAGARDRLGVAAGTVVWLVAIAFALLPLLGILSTAFSPAGGFWVFQIGHVTTSWWHQFLTDGQLRSALVTSLVAAVVAATVATVLSVMIAYAVAHRFRATGRPRSRAALLILTPLLVPALGLGLGIQNMYDRLSIPINSVSIGVAQAILIIPLTAGMITIALEAVPVSFERAAASLGAGSLRTAVSVVLPTIRTPLVGAAIIGFVRSFDDATIALFVNGPGHVTLPVELLFSNGSVQPALIAAAGSSLLVLGVAAAILLDRTVGLGAIAGARERAG
jgi:putative spermidine/putrescine transport system permease protein